MRRILPTFLLAAFLAGCSQAPPPEPYHDSEMKINGRLYRFTVDTATATSLIAINDGGKPIVLPSPVPAPDPPERGRFAGELATAPDPDVPGRRIPHFRLLDKQTGAAWRLDLPRNFRWRRE